MVENGVISVYICTLRKNQLKIAAKFRASSECYTGKRTNFGLKKWTQLSASGQTPTLPCFARRAASFASWRASLRRAARLRNDCAGLVDNAGAS